MVTLMRRMQALEEERKGVLHELAALGAPGADEDRRRRNRSNGMEEFDLVAMWTETSETLQGVIAEREAQLECAMARCFKRVCFLSTPVPLIPVCVCVCGFPPAQGRRPGGAEEQPATGATRAKTLLRLQVRRPAHTAPARRVDSGGRAGRMTNDDIW